MKWPDSGFACLRRLSCLALSCLAFGLFTCVDATDADCLLYNLLPVEGSVCEHDFLPFSALDQNDES